MKTSVSRLRRLWMPIIGIACGVALASGQAVPKLQQEVSFHIEKGPLESALIQFSRQAEVQVVLASDAATNLTASAVHGRLAASAALTELLKGTGLAYTAVGNTVTVQASENKATTVPRLQKPSASLLGPVSHFPHLTRLKV